MFELRQIRQFLAVVEEGNFNRAAKRLFMTQPPLSMAIRKLEDDMGCLLLERQAKSFSLTPAGEVFYREAKRLVKNAEDMERLVREVADGTAGHLRLSCVGSSLHGKLPGVIRKFRRKYPLVQLELRIATTQEQHEMLRRGLADIGVVNEPAQLLEEFEVYPFDADKFCMALPSGHRLAKKGLGLAELRAEQFIIWPRAQGAGLYDKALELCRRAGFQPNIIQEAHQMQAVLSLVAVEAGVAVIPQSMAGLRPDEISYFPIKDEQAEFHRSLLSRKGEHNQAVHNFLNMVLHASAE